jgi:NADH-quinone oxidoreductase subunit E
MSIFSNPWQPVRSTEDWNRMSEEFTAPLRKDITAAMSLMVSPVASFAAMSALGFGLASHAFGVWAGAVAGAAQASQRFFATFDLGEGSPATQPKETKDPAAAVVAIPVRPKPALKIVPKAEVAAAELVAAVPLAEPAKAAEPVAKAAASAKPAKAEAIEPTKVAVSKPARAKAAEPAKAKAAEPAKLKTAEPAKLKTAEPAKPAAEPVKSDAALPAPASRKPRSIERPAAPDDLKAISGIGPKLEKVLNDLGVWTYAQIAAWSKEEIAWVDDYLSFKGRIDRDGWIAQAAKLAGVGKS